MVDIASIKTALYTWAYSVTSWATIWEDQNAPRPIRPYVTLRILSINKIGQDWESGITVGAGPGYVGSRSIYGTRDLTVSARCIGAGAFQKIEYLQTSTEDPAVRATLRAGGLAYVDTALAAYTGDLDPANAQFIEEATLDTVFRAPSMLIKTFDRIEDVDIRSRLMVDSITITIDTITINT